MFASRGGGHYGVPHEGKARSCIVPFIDQDETLSALLDDERVLGVASALLGDDFNYTVSDGNYYVGSTSWHTDGFNTGPQHIKLAFYLDPVTAATGALRVVPGSHTIDAPYFEKLRTEIWGSEANWGVDGAGVPCVALETQPGDLVCFNHNILHSSFGGNASRRMFTINLCQRYPQSEIQGLRDWIGALARFWNERNYGEIMVRTAGPERMRHLEQCMANDGHLAELSRKARESMPEPARG